MANDASKGFLRLRDIIGDPKRGIEPLIPVSKSSWYQGIVKGIYPAPVELKTRTSGWRREEIDVCIAQFRSNAPRNGLTPSKPLGIQDGETTFNLLLMVLSMNEGNISFGDEVDAIDFEIDRFLEKLPDDSREAPPSAFRIISDLRTRRRQAMARGKAVYRELDAAWRRDRWDAEDTRKVFKWVRIDWERDQIETELTTGQRISSVLGHLEQPQAI